jgi:hypothetical protein
VGDSSRPKSALIAFEEAKLRLRQAINLTGDYVWRQNRRAESGKFRPLRPPVAIP